MAKVLPGTYTNGLGYKDIRKPPQTYWSEIINATATITPPSLATVTGGVSAAIPVSGAPLGARVNVFPPYTTQGVMSEGFVDTAGNVKISFFNPTGATVALAEGDWQIQVVVP